MNLNKKSKKENLLPFSHAAATVFLLAKDYTIAQFSQNSFSVILCTRIKESKETALPCVNSGTRGGSMIKGTNVWGLLKGGGMTE